MLPDRPGAELILVTNAWLVVVPHRLIALTETVTRPGVVPKVMVGLDVPSSDVTAASPVMIHA
jgi:hypothetical protein